MGGHVVQFYENDDYLIEGLSRYIGDALADGDKGVVIATRAHLDGLESALRRAGLIGPDAARDGLYTGLEAGAMLPQFVDDGVPDGARFERVIGDVIRAAGAGHAGRVFVFGEMTAILHACNRSAPVTDLRHDAALRVENYFNDLQQRYAFDLLCGYPLSAFPCEKDALQFHDICKVHSQVLPAESYDPEAGIDTLQRSIAGLQQQAFALASEVYDRRQVEQALREVNVDRLTGLPNRSVFHDRLQMDIKKAHRSRLPLALFFIDLDHFKEINDTLGHDVGDQLLKQVGQRLSAYVRETDTMARLGGDEFTITLSELHELDTVTMVAQKVLQDLVRPFQLGHDMAYISASIGITLYPQDATSASELLRNADQAMYRSKDMGRNRFTYFTRSMQEAAQSRMALTNDLRNAIAGHQLRVEYQPIVELATGKLCKAEALIRWQHPVHGLIGPSNFIPIAEHTGMIIPIGDWVFHEALAQARRWRARQPGFSVSVNVSPAQFYRNNGENYRRWFLDNQGASAPLDGAGQAVGLEITENLLLAASASVMKQLREFHEAGIKISLDDFGTGYSSLGYLRKFSLDFLKIDQSFVYNLEHDAANVALCEAIIVMAHKLGLKVVAEGVETVQQCELLRHAGCDYGQGYLFGHAVPPEQFEMLLAAQGLPALSRQA